MGQIAEDILDGSCCQVCGQYFKHPKASGIYVHDYPVTCWECFGELSDTEQEETTKADVETF